MNLNPSSNFTAAERLESLKAGVLAGFCIGFTQMLLSSLNLWFLGQPLHILVSVPLTAVSGFLFGVTYRYIIRGDDNPQLKLGGIFAFGLVRALAEIELQLQTQTPLKQIAILAGENLLLFAIVGLILDQALQKSWIKSFR